MAKKYRAITLKIILVVILLTFAFLTKSLTNSERAKVNLKPANKAASVEPTEVLSTKLIGPMRSFANISIWMRAREYEDEGEYFELVSLFSLAKKLQPRNPKVYSYLSDLLINTISVKFTNEDSRWSSVIKGIDILEDGLAKLPSNANLHWKYALYYQGMTGRMPERILEQELNRKNSLLNLKPRWREESAILLVKIKALNHEDAFRLKNFCRDYGHTIIYGSEFKQNPAYMTLSDKLRNLILDVNNARVRLSYLQYFRSISKIGYNRMLLSYWMRRALETCAINGDDLKSVYPDLKKVFHEIRLLQPDKQVYYRAALKDFTDLENLYLRIYPNN
ncbi:MAG: hypothetical protein K8S87_04710 [Planctomycetes bacterium]|nr:hypothetical protein [Planctomycetota bacterium]